MMYFEMNNYNGNHNEFINLCRDEEITFERGQ